MATASDISEEVQLREHLRSLRGAAAVTSLQRTSIDASTLAADLKNLSFSGVDERYTSIEGLPQYTVRWEEPATAAEFMKALQHVDRSELPALRSAVDKAHALLQSTSELADEYERIKRLIDNEVARIDAIKLEQSSPPGSLAPEQRVAIRSALNEFERLQRELTAAEQIDPQLDRARSWWCLARVAVVADSMVEESGIADQVRSTDVQQTLDTLRAFAAEMIELSSYLPPRQSATLWQAGTRRTVAQVARDLMREFAPLHEQFLRLPGLEGRAIVEKIISSIGSHALLSVSTLSGFVGLCGYVKASRELNRMDLSALTLISTTDVANFAIAMAVPFLILVAGLVGLPYFWSESLVADHRSPWHYASRLIRPLAVIVATYVLFRLWAHMNVWPISPDVETVAWIALLLAGAWPAWRLYVAGRLNGVHDDDIVQLSILKRLRFASSTVGLLAGLLLTGVILMLVDNVSTVVPTRLPAIDPQRALRVLESKSYPEPMLAAAAPSRVGDHWVIRRAPEPVKEVLHQVSTRRGAISLDAWPVFLINRNDVVCVRRLDDGETTLTHQCVPTPAKPPAAPYAQNTIARLATERLECGRDSFDGETSVAVVRFPFNLPADATQAQAWTPSGPDYWRTSSSRLQIPALRGIHPRIDDQATASSLRERLENDTATSLWILGFASTPGAASSNVDLAERRAEALKEHLLRTELAQVSSIRERTKVVPVGEGILSGVQAAEHAQLAIAFVCTSST